MKSIHIEGCSFYDSAGRERIFHGMNFMFPGNRKDYPRDYFFNVTNSELAEYKYNGFNLIRLAVFWDAVEHEMGRYDDEYLEHISEFISKCSRNGIYTYIVLYQHQYACFMNGGCGAPLWATDTGNRTYMRVKYDASQLQYFFNPAVSNAFNNFWNNKSIAGKGLHDRYIDMINHIMPFFRDKPGFLGIDFFNEPFPGKSSVNALMIAVYRAAEEVIKSKSITNRQAFRILLSSKYKYNIFNYIDNKEIFEEVINSAKYISLEFDRKIYNQFFEKVYDEIKNECGSGFIFKENNYLSNIGMPCGIEIPAGRNIVYSPNGFDIVNGTKVDENAVMDSRTDIIFSRHKNIQDKYNCPVIVGKWGRHSGGEKGLDHISHELDIFDRYKWSSAFFKYDKNIFNSPIANVLIRPYPIAAAGKIDFFEYSKNEKTFRMQCSQKREKEMETVIYLPSEPIKIETDGKYLISDNMLKITTGMGVHKAEIKF